MEESKSFEETFKISFEEELDNPVWDACHKEHPDYEKYRRTWVNYAKKHRDIWHTLSNRERRLIAHYHEKTQGWC
jgi:hypothetical protein